MPKPTSHTGALLAPWVSAMRGFKAYLQLEKNLSEHSVDAYIRDVRKLALWCSSENKKPEQVVLDDVTAMLARFVDLGLGKRTQSRWVSGVRAFFEYTQMERITPGNPVELLQTPRLDRTLPDVLSIAQIDAMLAAIDRSKPLGQRDRAMLEVMYSSGLRVSELVGLQISQLHLEEDFIRVLGKGNKERLVPIGTSAKNQLRIYLDEVRVHQAPIVEHSDTVFLNYRGGGMSRVSVFNLVKRLAGAAGITQKVSPHTFRHSFATHLVDAGADLRAVQEMLGHASITTTEIYTHLDRSYLRSEILSHHPRNRGN